MVERNGWLAGVGTESAVHGGDGEVVGVVAVAAAGAGPAAAAEQRLVRLRPAAGLFASAVLAAAASLRRLHARIRVLDGLSQLRDVKSDT